MIGVRSGQVRLIGISSGQVKLGYLDLRAEVSSRALVAIQNQSEVVAYCSVQSCSATLCLTLEFGFNHQMNARQSLNDCCGEEPG